jgi:hypothetical protein
MSFSLHSFGLTQNTIRIIVRSVSFRPCRLLSPRSIADLIPPLLLPHLLHPNRHSLVDSPTTSSPPKPPTSKPLTSAKPTPTPNKPRIARPLPGLKRPLVCPLPNPRKPLHVCWKLGVRSFRLGWRSRDRLRGDGGRGCRAGCIPLDDRFDMSNMCNDVSDEVNNRKS